MFERFTERARRVMVLAQEEARLLNHNFIGTDHLLLGLVREGEGIAAIVLQRMAFSLEAIRMKVEERAGVPTAQAGGSPPFTRDAKKALEGALREALDLGHSYIGTEHLLLGICRDAESTGSLILCDLGTEPARVRAEVMATLGDVLTPSRGRAEAEAWTSGATAAGCPSCGSRVETLRSRLVPIESDETEADQPAGETLRVMCCPVCGVILGTGPT